LGFEEEGAQGAVVAVESRWAEAVCHCPFLCLLAFHGWIGCRELRNP
jgi:hypothetical protein